MANDDKALPLVNKSAVDAGTSIWKVDGQDAFTIAEQEGIAKVLGIPLDRVKFAYTKERNGEIAGTTMSGSK